MQGGRCVCGCGCVCGGGKSRTRAGSIECPPRHSASVQSIQTMDLNSSVASLQGGGGAYTGPLIAKVDIRVGKIVKVRYQSPDVGHSDPFDHGSYVRARMIHSFVRAQAWPHPDSDKLWCEEIDVGEVRSLSRCFGAWGGMQISRRCTHSSSASPWPEPCAGKDAPNRLWTAQALHPGAALTH